MEEKLKGTNITVIRKEKNGFTEIKINGKLFIRTKTEWVDEFIKNFNSLRHRYHCIDRTNESK